jgi:hypothetical protein
MRGLFYLVRSIIDNVREFGLSADLDNLRDDAATVLNRRFGNHLGGSLSGLFLRVPFTRLSLWLGWWEVNVGLVVERSTGTIEFFLGRLQGVACIEPVEA